MTVEEAFAALRIALEIRVLEWARGRGTYELYLRLQELKGREPLPLLADWPREEK